MTTPSCGIVSAWTGWPSKPTSRLPFFQGVSNRLRPGAGPSDSTGIASAAARPPNAASRPPWSIRRRLNPASSVRASATAALPSGPVPIGWRASSRSSLDISSCAHTTIPAPSPPRHTARRTPWICVSPPTAYTPSSTSPVSASPRSTPRRAARRAASRPVTSGLGRPVRGSLPGARRTGRRVEQRQPDRDRDQPRRRGPPLRSGRRPAWVHRGSSAHRWRCRRAALVEPEVGMAPGPMIVASATVVASALPRSTAT